MHDFEQTKLFSQSRLNGYLNTKEHEANLLLISKIAHKIGILEIIIRNRIDFLLCTNDIDWLENLPISLKPKDLQKQSKDEFISQQNLGFWLKVSDFYKIHDKIFNISFLDTLDFKIYFHKNKNRFANKANFRRYQKARAILELLRIIRNRAFHFENLYKFVGNHRYPRLNTKISSPKAANEIYIAIAPTKIIKFLNDILSSFHKDLVDYAQSQGGGKGSA